MSVEVRETDKAPNSSTSSQLHSVLLDREDRSSRESEMLWSMTAKYLSAVLMITKLEA